MSDFSLSHIGNDDCPTPKDFYEKLDREFHFH